MVHAPARPRRILFLDTNYHDPRTLGALEYARESGWATVFSPSLSLSLEAHVERWHADGVISQHVPPGDLALTKHPVPFPVPVVWTNDMLLDVPGFAGVLLDYPAGGRMVAEHFIDAGFRNLAYCWLGDAWSLNEQLAGFREAAEAAGRTVHVLDWPARQADRAGTYPDVFRDWLVRQVADLPTPLGLMVESDWTGIDAVTGLRDAGILVPDQVAVVGCYNMEPICQGACVPLSSVDMNWREQGYQAAALLDRMLGGKKPPKNLLRISPRGVVVRQSSDVMAVPHAGVARAMYLIRENFGDPELTVGRLAERVGITAVALNKAFRRHLGLSPGERLRQTRLRAAMSLLETTDRTVQDIAAACGYGTLKQLIRCVKQATGMPPRAWRMSQKARATLPRPQP